jgi:hypothetical protein
MLIQLNSKVVAANPASEARVELPPGDLLSGDAAISADGVKFNIYRQMASAHCVVGHSRPPGNNVYQVFTPKVGIGYDDAALELLKKNFGTRWNVSSDTAWLIPSGKTPCSSNLIIPKIQALRVSAPSSDRIPLLGDSKSI